MTQVRRLPAARQVRDRSELEQALALVHDNYVRCGYMKPHPSGMRLNVHYALPSTRTFVSVVDDEVTATVSLFCDSALGLPMDHLYARELRPLREEGRHIGEVGMLADRRRSLSRALPVLLKMMKRLFCSARHLDLSDLMITVNPKHKAFYARMLCFEEYGPQKSCQTVNGAPAVLLRINMVALREENVQRERIRKLFFSPLPEGSAYRGDYQMRPEDLEYFFLEKTDLLRQADNESLSAIESQYPGLKLRRLEKQPVG